MKTILSLMKKHKSFILYAVFGVLTTVVNLVIYNLCYYKSGMSNTLSNILAWFFAVAFAYLTNKIWVFESKSWKWNVLRREVSAFFGCRIATGLLDVIIMYVCVDVFGWYAMLMKLISNVLVIVLNYIFSKLLIFKK